jgi:hypothetical protein
MLVAPESLIRPGSLSADSTRWAREPASTGCTLAGAEQDSPRLSRVLIYSCGWLGRTGFDTLSRGFPWTLVDR